MKLKEAANSWVWVLVGLSVLLHLFFLWGDPSPGLDLGRGPYTDPAGYSLNARNLALCHSGSLSDTPGFVAPLHSMWLMPWTVLLGSHYSTPRLAVYAAWLLFLVLWLRGRAFVPIRQYSAVLWCFSFPLFHYMGLGFAHSFASIMVLFALHFLLEAPHALPEKRFRHWLLAQLCASAAMGVHFSYIHLGVLPFGVLLALLLLYLPFRQQEHWKPAILGISMGLVLHAVAYGLWLATHPQVIQLMAYEFGGGGNGDVASPLGERLRTIWQLRSQIHEMGATLLGLVACVLALVCWYIVRYGSLGNSPPTLAMRKHLPWALLLPVGMVLLLEIPKWTLSYHPSRYFLLQYAMLSVWLAVALQVLALQARRLATAVLAFVLLLNSWNLAVKPGFDTAQDIRNLVHYIETYTQPCDLVIGSWAPVATQGDKPLRTKLIYQENEQHFGQGRNPILRDKPQVLVVDELDPNDSEGCYNLENIRLKSVAVHSRRMKVGNYYVWVYWMPDVRRPKFRPGD